MQITQPALVLIDVQREYFDPASPLVIPDGPAVLDRLAGLLGTARAAGVAIIHVRHEEAPGTGVFEPGSDNAAIVDQVAPAAGEPTILKHLPSAFDGTNLDTILEDIGTRTLVIGGFMTHMCCDSTARSAQARGFDVVFLADGTATRDLVAPSGRTIPHDQVHEATLAAQADGFSDVRPVADISW